MSSPRIAVVPSILSADLGRLQEEVASIEKFADAIQVDVMDGHFVPNLTFGAPVMKAIKTKLPLDIHLMVSNPADRIKEFLAINAKQITFHAEAAQSVEERTKIIAAIRKGGAHAGIAINPATPLSAIDDVVADIDLVLVMSVVPGFSGQAFMPEVLEKVRVLRSKFPKLAIQMDGGIDDKTAPLCREAGATSLVAASFIFKSSDRAAAIASLRGDA